MSRQFKLAVLANAVFVLMYVFFNWFEYDLLKSGDPLRVQTNFPAYIQGTINYADPAITGFESFILPNYLLLIFIVATVTNLYFIFKLRSQ
jgi:hypothetical protein